MLMIRCPEEFEKAMLFARSVGAVEAFLKALSYADWHGERNTITSIYPDFAPNSFTFKRELLDDVTFAVVNTIAGGVIYSGPGAVATGVSPALSVSLDPENGEKHLWSVHT